MNKQIVPPARFPCGKRRPAQRIADAQRAAEESEMRVVLAQPHRRGNRSQLAESPLGRFCLSMELPRELFDAGETYACIVHKWRRAKQVPSTTRLGGSSPEPEDEEVRKLRELISEWERTMEDAGEWIGKVSAICLAMNEPIDLKINAELASRALYALAKYQGRLSRKT